MKTTITKTKTGFLVYTRFDWNGEKHGAQEYHYEQTGELSFTKWWWHGKQIEGLGEDEQKRKFIARNNIERTKEITAKYAGIGD